MLESLNRVDTPALLLDFDALRSNLRTMAAFFDGVSADLRPHFDTHKCTRIAKLQMEAGAVGMTCAKVGEAEILVGAGIRDILIATQVVGAIKIERLMGLIGRHIDVKVAADDETNLRELSRATTARSVELGVLVQVDLGTGRWGVAPGEKLVDLCRFVDESPNLVFRGLMAFDGDVAMEQDLEKRRALTGRIVRDLVAAKIQVEDAGLEVEIVSVGNTGTYDVAGECPDVTEVRAGSYAVMDARYRTTRDEFRPALSLLSTVISRPRPDVAVTDAGLKSLSADAGLPKALGTEGIVVRQLAEEHAILSVPPDVTLNVGDRVALVPSHAATTVNLHSEYVLVERTRERARWPIEARGKTQ